MIEKQAIFDSLSYKDQYELLRIKSLQDISLNAVRGYAMNIKRFAARGLEMKMPEIYGKKDRTTIVDRPELIGRKARPPPLRVNAPLYTDIVEAGHFFSRDNILDEINKMKITASALGKNVDMLTDVEFPCNVFGSSFMMAPSSPYKDVVSHVINKEAINKIVSQSSAHGIITIWAENSKAFARYAKPDIREIFVIYTSDYPSQEFEKYVGYAKGVSPYVVITSLELDCTLDELCAMSSQEFIFKYKLNSSYLFLCNFLPQAVHLGYDFAEMACVCLDSDSVRDIPRISAPPRLCDSVQDSQSLMMYLLDNHCSILRDNASYGFYDVVSNSRISYSDHMCYRDSIFSGHVFPPNVTKVRAVDFLSRMESDSNLKIIYMFESIPTFIVTDVPLNSINVSCVAGLTDVLYLPSVSIIPVIVPSDGFIELNGFRYSDFPASKRILTGKVGDNTYVLDVDYRSFSFLSRRRKIPEELRMPYSSVPMWDFNFLVFPEATILADAFYFSVADYLDGVLGDNSSIKKPPDLRISGMGWNPSLLRVVFDDNCFITKSPWQDIVIQKTPFSFNFEFSSSKSIRRIVSFGELDFYYSDSTNIVPDENLIEVLEYYFQASAFIFVEYYRTCVSNVVWEDYC